MEQIDSNERETGLETDPRFPSGPWTGYFLQRLMPGRNWMELQLTFQNGRIRGEGRDRVGEFLMTGEYKLPDGTCTIWKQYVGRHQVTYSGYNEGKGIWGVWTIAAYGTGGFHIWPTAMREPGEPSLTESVDLPVAEPEPILV
jgi:hypothetical protein